MSNLLNEVLDGVNNVVLLGHLHPDGDCVGTCLGMYNYLSENYPQLTVDLYLDHPAGKFSYMKNFDRIKTEMEPGKVYELCITLDSSDAQRLGIFLPYFQDAGATLCKGRQTACSAIQPSRLWTTRNPSTRRSC